MRPELYATLRKRIVKVVPEIMELKFGCKVKIVGGSSFSGRVFDCVDGDMTVQPHPYGEGSLRSNGDSCGSCDFDKGEYEILGRDITLADVLRAMQEVDLPDDEFFAAYPYRDTKQKGFWLCHKKERDFDLNRDEYVISSKQWNLALPLHEQSDELGAWLMTVIK